MLELDDMVLLEPDSNYVSPRKTIDFPKRKVEIIVIKKSRNKKPIVNSNNPLSPQIDAISRKQVDFRNSYNCKIDVADIANKSYSNSSASTIYRGHKTERFQKKVRQTQPVKPTE